MAHGVVCHFDLPHMAQKVADWTRREGRPRADEMAHGAVCRFELPHVAENNHRVTRVDSSLWPQRTVPKLPSGTNGCQTLKTATLNTSYFCQKRPLCQPPPSPTPPPNSHLVRKVKLRLAYRLAFVINYSICIIYYIVLDSIFYICVTYGKWIRSSQDRRNAWRKLCLAPDSMVNLVLLTWLCNLGVLAFYSCLISPIFFAPSDHQSSTEDSRSSTQQGGSSWGKSL